MMRRPGGQISITSPDGVVEIDTFTCNHCNRIVQVQPKCAVEDLGGLCMVCNELICKHCVGHGCDPFEKKLERMEARDRMLREISAA